MHTVAAGGGLAEAEGEQAVLGRGGGGTPSLQYIRRSFMGRAPLGMAAQRTRIVGDDVRTNERGVAGTCRTHDLMVLSTV